MNFYRDAAEILEKLTARKGTVKGLCLQDKVKDKKKMYAVICETLKAKSTLLEILDKANFWNIEKKKNLSQNLVLVLCHDLLFRKRGIQAPAGPIKETIMAHKTRLKAELTKLRISRGALSDGDLFNNPNSIQVPIPRYIRVNTIKATTDQIITCFKNEGFSFTVSDVDWSNKKTNSISKDRHIDDLLLLPSGIDLHASPLVAAGKIVLQDKASCMPAFALYPPPGAHVIDACAAPGNKTSHLAMLMGNTGKIWALDLDARRLNTLKTLTSRAGATIIDPVNGNFLELDPHDDQFSKVEYLLLDPSCSGSGIVSRLDYLVDSSENETDDAKADRLASLAEFQIQIIEHAMKFPRARRLVYSTCSVHKEENEDVVSKILENYGQEWQLVNTLPSWPRRGLTDCGLTEEQAQCLVRCDPSQDATNGFFVALFEKKHPGSPLVKATATPILQPIPTETVTPVFHPSNNRHHSKPSPAPQPSHSHGQTPPPPSQKPKSQSKKAPRPLSKRKIHRSVTSQ